MAMGPIPQTSPTSCFVNGGRSSVPVDVRFPGRPAKVSNSCSRRVTRPACFRGRKTGDVSACARRSIFVRGRGGTTDRFASARLQRTAAAGSTPTPAPLAGGGLRPVVHRRAARQRRRTERVGTHPFGSELAAVGPRRSRDAAGDSARANDRGDRARTRAGRCRPRRDRGFSSTARSSAIGSTSSTRPGCTRSSPDWSRKNPTVKRTMGPEPIRSPTSNRPFYPASPARCCDGCSPGSESRATAGCCWSFRSGACPSCSGTAGWCA